MTDRPELHLSFFSIVLTLRVTALSLSPGDAIFSQPSNLFARPRQVGRGASGHGLSRVSASRKLRSICSIS